jgi:hypothetical protein
MAVLVITNLCSKILETFCLNPPPIPSGFLEKRKPRHDSSMWTRGVTRQHVAMLEANYWIGL